MTADLTRLGGVSALPGDMPQQAGVVIDGSGVTCTQQAPIVGTCIADLAAGWINARDLCPVCTGQFMGAMDGIDGPLKWHDLYTTRARAVSS